MADSDTKENPDNNNPIPYRTERHRPAASGQGFLRQVVSVYAIGALFLAMAAVVWLGGDVLLLLFACILLALLLYVASVKVQRWLPVSRGGCATTEAERVEGERCNFAARIFIQCLLDTLFYQYK